MKSRSSIVNALWDHEDRKIADLIRGPRDQKLLDCAAWFAEAVLENPTLQVKLAARGANMLELQKASGIGIGTQGGWLAPSLVADTILEYRAQASIIEQFATTWPINRGDELSVPRRATGFTMAFVDENTALAENSLVFDNITLTPRKVGAYVRLSQDLNEDAAESFADYVMAEAGNSTGLLIDDCGFNGDGSATYGGMRGINTLLVDGNHDAGKVAAASGSKTALSVTSADIAKLFAALPERYWPNARLYCSGNFASNGLARLAAATGGNIETALGLSYLGVPITVTPKMPACTSDSAGKVMAVFGDLSRGVALGVARELVMARSWQRYGEYDQLALRVTSRFHCVVHGCGDGTNAGPVVGLVGTT